MGKVYKSDVSSTISETNKSGNVDNKYTFRNQDLNLQYPLDLDDGVEFGQNRVLFFINVAGKSQIASGPNDAQYNADLEALGYQSVQTYDLPENQFYTASGSKGIAAVQDAASQLGAAGVIADAINALPVRKRLAAAIALYVPNSLSMSYSVNWSEEDLSFENMLETGATSALGAYNTGGVKGSGMDLAKTAGSVVAKSVLAGSNYAQKATGLTGANTQLEQLFKGVDFRSFSYDYDFAPRSEKEAEAVLQIIRMFRYHMLPEYLDKNAFLYVYPSEFDIKYYKGSAENPYLEKHITAVLTNCIINYTPAGQFNTFANGMPTHIKMQLQFKEIGKPSKETSQFEKSGA